MLKVSYFFIGRIIIDILSCSVCIQPILLLTCCLLSEQAGPGVIQFPPPPRDAEWRFPSEFVCRGSRHGGYRTLPPPLDTPPSGTKCHRSPALQGKTRLCIFCTVQIKYSWHVLKVNAFYTVHTVSQNDRSNWASNYFIVRRIACNNNIATLDNLSVSSTLELQFILRCEVLELEISKS